MIAEKKYILMKVNQSGGSSFSAGFITNYFFVRILFLCAYETWFRGYLLTDCINNLGIPFAIILNIILYSLLHYVNGKQEMRACVPFGLLLCGLCIWIGAAWPAILVHIALAVSYEAHLVKKINNPSISFI
jgi:membrane protease YdiL (CAAX protease family)